MKTFSSLLLLTATAAAEEWAYGDDSCEDPIQISTTCTTSSLCNGNYANDATAAYCFQMRSCFLGYCTTSDLVEMDNVDDVCALIDDSETEFCVDGWDSTWWMTDYYEAVDCNDSSLIYLDCYQTIGDVSESTAASLGFSALGVAVLVGYLVQKRRRRKSAAHISFEEEEQPHSEMAPTSGFVQMT